MRVTEFIYIPRRRSNNKRVLAVFVLHRVYSDITLIYFVFPFFFCFHLPARSTPVTTSIVYRHTGSINSSSSSSNARKLAGYCVRWFFFFIYNYFNETKVFDKTKNCIRRRGVRGKFLFFSFKNSPVANAFVNNIFRACLL